MIGLQRHQAGPLLRMTLDVANSWLFKNVWQLQVGPYFRMNIFTNTHSAFISIFMYSITVEKIHRGAALQFHPRILSLPLSSSLQIPLNTAALNSSYREVSDVKIHLCGSIVCGLAPQPFLRPYIPKYAFNGRQRSLYR